MFQSVPQLNSTVGWPAIRERALLIIVSFLRSEMALRCFTSNCGAWFQNVLRLNTAAVWPAIREGALPMGFPSLCPEMALLAAQQFYRKNGATANTADPEGDEHYPPMPECPVVFQLANGPFFGQPICLPVPSGRIRRHPSRVV